jgi:F-type H+-transporting ATPase subunit epsilon
MSNKKQILIRIATPEKTLLNDECDQISVSTIMGELTILPGHVSLVTTLKPGEVKLKKGSENTIIAISSGVLEIRSDSGVTILADTAERVEEIDMKRAEEARERVKKMMERKDNVEEVNYAKLQAKIEKEMARIKIVKKYGRTRK